MTPSDTAHPEGEREAAIKLAEALENIAHGRYPPVRPVDGKCAHGRLTTDDCERCIEKHAKDALTAYRQSPQPPAVARPQGEEGLWRPIGEAPRDGTRILTISAAGTQGVNWWRKADTSSGGYWAGSPNNRPDFWQPLPAPPAPNTKDQDHG